MSWHRETPKFRTLANGAALAVLVEALVLPVEQVLHAKVGGHGTEAIGPVAHALRDGALLLPVLVVIVLLALRLCRAIAGARSFTEVVRSTGVFVPTMSLAVGITFGAGVPVHALLFEGPGAIAAGGGAFTWLGHMRDDGALAAAVAIPILLTLSVGARIFDARLAEIRRAATRPRRRFTMAMCAVLAIAGGTGVVLAAVAGPAAADLASVPCPASAPTRHFAVAALDVDITLNRFGDHDPKGKMYVLQDRIADVRAEEASKQVSVGLQGDAIQPLVMRANLGDCVEVDFRNDAAEEYGLHIDGLAFTAESSGESVGSGAPTSVPPGGTRTYRYFIPDEATMEGAHYMRPGPGRRSAVSHGLFGALVAEPEGATYANASTGDPMESGWQAIISVPGHKAFREFTQLYHEVGNEDYKVLDFDDQPLKLVDPHTEAYRPGTRAINYRSEPFMHRLDRADRQKSLAYNSYTFGDPATPIMRSYLGEPTKMRLLHAGSEQFHVFHLHGGGIRWRANPVADDGFDYQHTGLDKHPLPQSASMRLDSQAVGPGESFNLEIEGGAGGVQQTVGDLLEHCHIAEHYNSGMWTFWRVFNTRVPDLQPLPDRAAPPTSVDSRGLLGRTMPDGTTLSAANIDTWISGMLPPRGVPKNAQDASVWNWKLDTSTPAQPLALGEPEDGSDWPDLRDGAHPGGMPGDDFVGNRPEIRFNPVDGRPAFPLLRPHIGARAPFSPRHSGTPFLGPRVDANKTTTVDPYAKRPDGLCPANAPTRKFGISSIVVPIPVTPTKSDPTGMIFTLNKNKAAIRAGSRPAEPLAIRANLGDCVGVDFTSETTDAAAFDGYAKNNMHIHHVQFDVQGSDGASAGFVFDQSVRPYKIEDVKLTARAKKGTTTLQVSSSAKFQPGVWLGIGLGTDTLEVRQVASIANRTIRLTEALGATRESGTWVGTEFARYQWYPDVELDNVFWHDHVDGIHGWPKGLVGQLIVEPPGSTYHDPSTGAQVDSGTIVDVHTTNALVPGVVDGSFRELALWMIDENPVAGSTLNLRATPWAARLAVNPDPSVLFSSWVHGDPNTPLPRAYPGDPFVIRTINVGTNGVDTLHTDGHSSALEFRHRNVSGTRDATASDTQHMGISERFTRVLEGGAGGPGKRPGDYLYMNGVGRHFRDGAWGILRVLAGRSTSLMPLPGRPTPANGPATPVKNGQRPPAPTSPGQPCPTGAPVRAFDISAIDLSGKVERGPGIRAAFVPTSEVTAIQRDRPAEPLVLHVAEGECLEVTLRNQRAAVGTTPVPRVSFHVSELERTTDSSGVNVGFNPEQTVAGGQSRVYRLFAASDKVGGALITDMGTPTKPVEGLYGMVVVAPPGSSFRSPWNVPTAIGTQVIVDPPNAPSYRDFGLLIFDDDDKIGGDTMPYPVDVNGKPSINYSTAGVTPDAADAFHVDPGQGPGTPVLEAYAGDPTRIHVAVVAGSEQPHVFGLGGHSWPGDPFIARSNLLTAQGMAAWEVFDLHPRAGIGGLTDKVGDSFYGDLRRPFTEAGIWGIVRIRAADDCISSVIGLPGSLCEGG